MVGSRQGRLTQADSTRTVSIHWQHTDGNQDQVLLSGPLGAGALELRRRGTELFWLDDGLEQPRRHCPCTVKPAARRTTCH